MRKTRGTQQEFEEDREYIIPRAHQLYANLTDHEKDFLYGLIFPGVDFNDLSKCKDQLTRFMVQPEMREAHLQTITLKVARYEVTQCAGKPLSHYYEFEAMKTAAKKMARDFSSKRDIDYTGIARPPAQR